MYNLLIISVDENGELNNHLSANPIIDSWVDYRRERWWF